MTKQSTFSMKARGRHTNAIGAIAPPIVNCILLLYITAGISFLLARESK